MATFFGSEFMYNGTLSSRFGLMIAYINSSSGEEHAMSPAVNLVSYKLPRRSKVYQLGAEIEGDGTFEFQISFFRKQDQPIMASERDAISKWLCSDFSFKPLRIIQDDMSSVYYNCFFKSLRYVAFAGYANGFVADVVCDAPFAWKNRKVKEKINSSVSPGYYPDVTNIELYNTSSDHNLTIPSLIEVDLGENSTGFKLTNLSNHSEFFEFRNLVVGEKIRIDDLYCIESVTRPNTIIVDCFSGEFLRLINGINRIVINGQIKRIKIAYQSGRKIG